MKSLILLITLLLFSAQAQIITDDYGRVVTVPDKITKIYAAHPPLTMSVIAFDPNLVTALNSPFKEEQKPYVGAAATRPIVGGFFGQGNTPNFEILASVKPDIILMWGGATGAENHLKKFTALGIPVLMVSNDSINDLVSQFTLYGKLTGNTKRAKELVAYTQETLGLIQSLQKKLDTRKDVRYYFAEGLDGLSSECDGSFHLEPFTYSGGKNALNCKMSSNFGMEKISIETILLSDPDVIVAMEKGFADSISENTKLNTLRAVKSGRVLTVPSLPFNYITRPPSFMRLRLFLQNGSLSQEQLELFFNHLPFDITFVDENDRVVFFNKGPERTFTRSPGVIGREVKFCHPPKSVDTVLKIVGAFKDRSKDSSEFWITFNERLVYIRYFALRDKDKNYKGVVEITQDITDIKKIEGKRRLLSWE